MKHKQRGEQQEITSIRTSMNLNCFGKNTFIKIHYTLGLFQVSKLIVEFIVLV